MMNNNVENEWKIPVYKVKKHRVFDNGSSKFILYIANVDIYV